MLGRRKVSGRFSVGGGNFSLWGQILCGTLKTHKTIGAGWDGARSALDTLWLTVMKNAAVKYPRARLYSYVVAVDHLTNSFIPKYDAC